MFRDQYADVAARFGQRILTENLGRAATHALLHAEGPADWHVSPTSVQRFLTWLHSPDGQAALSTPEVAADVRYTEDGDSASLEAPQGSRIRTVDELLAYAKVDLNTWRVQRAVVNVYEQGSMPRRVGNDKDGWSRPNSDAVVTPLYQVKVWLERKVDELELRALHAELIEDARRYAPRIAALPRLHRAQPEHALVAGLMDLHVGRLVWAAETGGAPWGVEIARERALAAVERMAARAERDGVEKVIIPIGNDLMHVDSQAGTTTAGTRQDTQVRYREMKRLAFQIMVDIIDTFTQLAPVEAYSVPGNHGRQSDMDICERLHAFYSRADDVTVSIDPRPRQYAQYGVNLLGFTHGDREKPAQLPMLMPLEQPDLWAATRYREFLIGHWHAKGETHFRPLVDNGVVVRTAPSLTSADAWHAEQGYVGSWRACEGYLYHRHDGYAGTISISAHALERGA